MEKAPDFRSIYKEDFKEYVGFMTGLGRKFKVETTILKAFDRYLIANRIVSIDEDAVLDFVYSIDKLTNQQYEKRYRTIRKFTEYVALKYDGNPIPYGPKLPSDGKYIAYHYTDEEIGMLLERMAPRRKGEKYRIAYYAHQVIVGLLASTGLRISEATELRKSDVDLDEGVIFVKSTKFKKKRYVPVHPSVTAMLTEYAADREAVFPRPDCDGPFFASSAGTAITYSTFNSAYKRAVREAGLERDGESPRVHDLRHTFAVNRFARWYDEGIDPSDKMLAFSTYAGHVKFESSIYYLDMTVEAMSAGSKGFKLGSDKSGK